MVKFVILELDCTNVIGLCMQPDAVCRRLIATTAIVGGNHGKTG